MTYRYVNIFWGEKEENDGRATRGKPKSRMPNNARDKKRNYKREGNRK